MVNSYLHYNEICGDSYWGSVSDRDASVMIDLVERVAAIPGPIIEVGTLFGQTAELIAARKPVQKQLLSIVARAVHEIFGDLVMVSGWVWAVTDL